MTTPTHYPPMNFSARSALLLALILTGCGSSKSSSSSASAEAGASGLPVIDVDADCPVIVSESNCDRTQRPILFVHGTYDSGVTATNVAQLFASNGFCSDRFAAMDYDSLVDLTALTGSGQANNATPAIDAAIDALIAANPPFTQVNIMCHSQGALQCYSYLDDPGHAAKVAHYVQLAGGPESAPPGPPDGGAVPTLSISSMSDTVEGPEGVTGAEKTVLLTWEDHQAVACSTDTFVAAFEYLHQGSDGGPDGLTPQYTTIQCSDPTITLSGLSETLGDNQPPPPGERLEVYELSDPRDSGAPVQVFSDPDGGLITWQAKRLVPYEFRGVSPDGGTIGHQYFAPFKRDDRWLRFVVPSTDPIAAVATNAITSLNDNAETTFIFRSASGAFRPDHGDTLTVNGTEILNSEDATTKTVTVALFGFDANKDGKSELGVTSEPGAPFVPYFIRGTDLFIASSPPAFVQLNFDGLQMAVPNWPSVTQGLTEVSFP